MDTIGLSTPPANASLKPPITVKQGQPIGAQQANTNDEIISVAQKFEALMIHTMLKSMRTTMVENELSGSDQQDMYRDMMDQEIAKNISEAGGFGIQAMLATQLGAERDAINNALSDSGKTANKASQLQQYQKISGVSDVMFNAQSSLMPE